MEESAQRLHSQHKLNQEKKEKLQKQIDKEGGVSFNPTLYASPSKRMFS
jgi:hypothetical protein